MSIRDSLPPDDRDAFDEWAKAQRETNIKSMAASAMVMSIYPSSGEFDVGYALQTGAAILLDKPILVLVSPGQEIPPKLRLIADEIVEVSEDDIDTASPAIRAKIKAFMQKHDLGEGGEP